MGNEISLTNDLRGLAEFAHKLGLSNRDLKPVTLDLDPRRPCVALLPDAKGGLTVTNLKLLAPSEPDRKVVSRTLFDTESFVAYVNEHKTAATRIFAQLLKDPFTFAAVVDYHGSGAAGKPGWCDHVVTLELRKSAEFQTWSAVSGKMVGQVAFSEFLKDNRLAIVEPTNAEILNLVMALELTTDGRCVAKVPTNEGVTLRFETRVDASVNGQNVKIPDRIWLEMPVFVGMPSARIEADFKVRQDQGQVSFGVRMLALDKMVLDTVRESAAHVREKTGVPVYF